MKDNFVELTDNFYNWKIDVDADLEMITKRIDRLEERIRKLEKFILKKGDD